MAQAFSLASHTGGGVDQYLDKDIGELGEWVDVANKLLKSK